MGNGAEASVLGNLGTTLSLRVALRFPRRNEVCGMNSPLAWQEPGYSGESARLLRKRTCGGWNLGNVKVWQAAPETLQSKFQREKAAFVGRATYPC